MSKMRTSKLGSFESDETFPTGSIFTVYDYGELFANLDREEWKNRKQFFLTTLTFCLNLGNLLRLPQEVVLGHCKHYIYVYILASLMFGNAVLAFEVCLGQCSVQRFLRIFWQCPFLEGLPYAMSGICLLLSAYYSVLNVYSYLYIFPSFTDQQLEYSLCIVPNVNCSKTHYDVLTNPEYIYHRKRIVFYENNDNNTAIINWRNIGLLLFIWAAMCVVIVKGIRRIKWPFLLGGPIICSILLMTFGMTFMCNGASYGLSELFGLDKLQKFSMEHWVAILAQIMIGHGMGLGPLIIHGSCSKFHSPAHIDCFFLLLITLVASLLSVSIVYCGIGIRAVQYNTTVNSIINELRTNPEGIHIHVLFSQLFSRLPGGMSQVCSFLYFSALFCSGFLSLIWFTEVVVLAIYQVARVSDKYKTWANMTVCGVCVLLGIGLTKRGGDYIMHIFDRYFLGMCLIPMIIYEFTAIVICYGAFRFSDDIDIMLGFQPGLFYLCLWVLTPFILLLNFIYFLHIFTTRVIMNVSHRLLLIGVTLLIHFPVFFFAVCNTLIYMRKGRCFEVFLVPELFPDDSMMTIGEIYSSSIPSRRRVLFEEEHPVHKTQQEIMSKESEEDIFVQKASSSTDGKILSKPADNHGIRTIKEEEEEEEEYYSKTDGTFHSEVVETPKNSPRQDNHEEKK